MACYAAVVSLKQTLDQLRNNNNVPISFSSPEIIEFAYEEVRSMQKLLQELDLSSGLVQESGRSDEFVSYGWLGNSLDASLKRGKESRGGSRGFRDGGLQRMGSLDRKMREAACELEDVLETHFVNLICDNHPPTVTISMYLQELKRDVDSFSRTVKELKEEYTKEGEDEEEDEEVSISRIEFRGVKSNKMVGFSDVIRRMKDRFLEDILLVNIGSLVGMAGLGKTTLAKEFFEDPSVLNWFHHRAWVTVGPKYHLTDIVQSILIQVTGKELLVKKGDELASRLRRRLRHRRCLVVLDDVWNNEIITHVEDLIMGATFGDERGSLILLTTRLDKIGSSNRSITIDTLKLRFMNKEESWDLLSRKVFDEMPCPPHLEKAGKKIADNCEGLPLTVVTVADILSKSDEMTPEYWNKVAEQENSVFADAYDRMSAVLLRSYNYLPRYLKEYFLYLGVFPQKYDIPLSKLAMLWSVEGCFLSWPALTMCSMGCCTGPKKKEGPFLPSFVLPS